MTRSATAIAVEPVKYRDATRWRIPFRYFDVSGIAQESADEVARDSWKPGDACLAVYRRDTPDLATLHSAAPV